MQSYQSFSNSLLDELRHLAKTEREKGSYCERLTVAFFKNDAGWKHEFEDDWLYSDWAAIQGKDRQRLLAPLSETHSPELPVFVHFFFFV